jgi:hypothetical protein
LLGTIIAGACNAAPVAHVAQPAGCWYEAWLTVDVAQVEQLEHGDAQVVHGEAHVVHGAKPTECDEQPLHVETGANAAVCEEQLEHDETGAKLDA